MLKKLIIGPAGCGKTTRLLHEFSQELVHHRQPFSRHSFFLLPSAEHVDRIITQLFQQGVHGFFYHRVTTLSRLVSEVFTPGDEKVASNVTRLVILREILEKKSWPFFEKVQAMPGFSDLLASLVSELKESLITPVIFRRRMEHLKKQDPEMAVKYESLAALYESYENELAQRGLRDRQDDLRIFRERKKEARSLPRFEKIWLDGFFDFSGLQLEYLRELSSCTDDLSVALTMDPAKERSGLFKPIEETVSVLETLGFKIEVMKTPNRRAARPSLAYLEKNLFLEKKPQGAIPPPEGIEFFEAVGIQGEVEMIAREILRSYRSGGYRFSDFAVLLRQVSGYEPVIRSIFARYRIPVEIHERERLKLSPLIQTVVFLIKIFRDGWKREDLINFLKSSYVKRLGAAGTNRYEDASELENRAYAAGVIQTREAWMARWGGPQDEVFHTRKNAWLQSLAELEDSLRQAKNFLKMQKILLTALKQTFGIFETGTADLESSRRDAAGWKRLEALLREVHRQMENAGYRPEFDVFADQLLRLVEVDLYSLHDRSKNRVQVYGVSLARQKEYRVVFTAGMLERSFPQRMKEDPILSDRERRLWNSGEDKTCQDLLKPFLRERLPRQDMERYLFYLAATRARERLILTCPRFDLEGKEALPSFYLDEVRSVFNAEMPFEHAAFKAAEQRNFASAKLLPKRQDLAHPYPHADDAMNLRELEASVAGELWHIEPALKGREDFLAELLRGVLENPDSRRRFERAQYEITAEITDPAILEKDFFRANEPSSTRLEEYAKCPYKYFSNRVLKLKDPRENINIKQKGIIRHQVLENYFRHVVEKGALNPKASKEWVLKEVEKGLKEFPLMAEKKYKLDLDQDEIRDMLLRFLDKELERLKTTPFQPKYFEFAFGTKDNPDAPAFEIDCGKEKIHLTGIIDRIDSTGKDGAGLVIDYKTGAQFNRRDLDLGVSLQLPVYVKAMERFLKLKPVGAQLFSLKDGKTTGFYNGKNAGDFEEFAKKKAMDEAQFQAALDRSFEFIRRFVQAMRQGMIPVKPRVCEDYCSYPTVCRIQKWRLPLILKEIREEDEKVMGAAFAKAEGES